MWSHYAANHQGICIEYDAKEFSTNEPIFTQLHPVIYKKELFDASPYTNVFGGGSEQNPLLATIAACHKSGEWSYEEEWRLISSVSPEHNRPEYILTYRPKSISLGAKMSEKEKELVTAIAADLQIPVLQTSLAWNQFKLEFTEGGQSAPPNPFKEFFDT